MAATAAGLLPDATHRSLPGEWHVVPAPTLAPVLAEFLGDSRHGGAAGALAQPPAGRQATSGPDRGPAA